jgi:hypothetical protein
MQHQASNYAVRKKILALATKGNSKNELIRTTKYLQKETASL